MMTDPCRTCGHHEHKHPAGRQCRVRAVTGPPSDQGKPVGDGYDHIGRIATDCDCTTFIPQLEVAQ